MVAETLVDLVGRFDAFTVVALCFGLVWAFINLYVYLPVYSRAIYMLLFGGGDPATYDTATDMPPEELPTVDVFVPAYDEGETIGYAIRALNEVEYPEDKYTIHVLVEAGDLVTRRELARVPDRSGFNELVVPPTYPGRKNKPRALNYAYERTDGDVVGILDAEDIIDPDLFGQAVAALYEGDHDYVQGRLDMINEDDGLLNRLFRGEYGFWYRYVIPSFFRAGYAVPLGGTTNFFHRKTLQEAASIRFERFGSPWDDDVADDYTPAVPWDPRNVTEDFELGLLLWENDFDMAMMTATTHEESPVSVDAWVRQRTRWQKGKLYTFYHRLRNRPAGLREKFHVYTQAGIPHLGPFNLVGVGLIAGYANLVSPVRSPLVLLILVLGFGFVAQHMLIQGAGYWNVTDKRGLTRVRRTLENVFGTPIVWVLLWAADVRAVIQLAFEQHHWEKTKHTGRHIKDMDSGANSLLTSSGLSVDASTENGEWTWTVRRGSKPIARSTGGYASEAEARAAAESFAGMIPVAVGREAVFRTTDSGWTLVDENGDTVGRGSAPVEGSADRDAVAEVRRWAGTAPLGGPAEPAATGTDPEGSSTAH